MEGQSKSFNDYLKEEIDRVKGVYYPVRASLLRRTLVHKANCRKLHPNPEDEFCSPTVGPSQAIISKYVEEYRRDKKDPDVARFQHFGILEPLTVQKTKPDGYMLLNGHHRWAAAYMSGVKKVKIQIVNPTLEQDIREMLLNSSSNKRVTLDLDEVVFRPADYPHLEKPLPFPFNRIYKENIRLGIPALFSFLNQRGYDIWVYTANYYSMEYIRNMFRHRGVRLTGIVTGTGRKAPRGLDIAGNTKKLLDNQYRTTIHIDNEAVLRTFSGSKECQEHPLSGNAEKWSGEVMDIIGEMTPNE